MGRSGADRRLQAVNFQPISADAPELPVPGLFVARKRIVQIAKIA